MTTDGTMNSDDDDNGDDVNVGRIHSWRCSCGDFNNCFAYWLVYMSRMLILYLNNY